MPSDLLLIAHFCDDFDGRGNNRFNYLAELFAENGFDVEMITSDFSHGKKARRAPSDTGRFGYKITYIHEPAYTKNVSLKRFHSHYVMGRNLKTYLRYRKKPDLIYCAVPSLDVAGAAAVYASRNSVPFVVDVQDLWPEAFEMVFRLPVVSGLLFQPMQRRADYIYSAANRIVAVSQTYADRALRVNSRRKSAHSVYIGTELSAFDALAEQNKSVKPEDEFRVAYAGTLGHSYDLITVIDALAIVKSKGIQNIKFIVMGDGPLGAGFKAHATASGIDCEFTGRLSYGEMAGILKACDIAVNPIRARTAASIINKHADYAAAGLPVLNTQESPEYTALVDEYEMGINCKNGDPSDLAEKLLTLYHNPDLRRTMSQNSRRLAEEKFDRGLTYREIVNLVQSLTDRD